MKKIYVLFLGVALLSSCNPNGNLESTEKRPEETVAQKKDPEKKEAEKNCSVIKMSSSGQGNTRYEYDTQGRVTKAIDVIQEGRSTYTIENLYQYDTDKITVVQNFAGSFLAKYIFALSNGRIVSMQYFEEENGNAVSDNVYNYNTDGYLSKIVNGEDDTEAEEKITEISYRNGNISTLTNSQEDQPFTAVYNTNKRSAFTEQLQDLFSGSFLATAHEGILYEQGLFGKIISNQLESLSFGGEKIDLKYTADANGVTNKITLTSAGESLSYDFEVNCQK